jgi:hypothetical protein
MSIKKVVLPNHSVSVAAAGPGMSRWPISITWGVISPLIVRVGNKQVAARIIPDPFSTVLCA